MIITAGIILATLVFAMKEDPKPTVKTEAQKVFEAIDEPIEDFSLE